MFGSLEEECTRFRKKKRKNKKRKKREKKRKKRKKKEKILFAAKIGLVGIKKYLKT